MKRLIALLLALILALGGLVSAIADEQPEENLAGTPEEVLKEDAVTEEQPEEEPEEKPAEESAGEPDEEPAEEPAKEPVEQPDEEREEIPAEEPAGEQEAGPYEEPVEEPAEEEPAEELVEKSADEPVQEPAEQPAEEAVEDPAEEPGETFIPDRIMNVGEEADGTLSAGKDYVIRFQGISGDIWIEAEASFALKMTVTDEANGQTRVFQGGGDAPLAVSLNGQAGRTYRLSISAENSFTAGTFHIEISRAEESAAEEAREPEQDDGTLADNSAPKTEAAATLKVPTIKKITQKDASVTITWTAVSGAKKYRIYCKKGSGSWKLLANLNGKNNTSYTHKTKVTASVSGNKFQYRVCAIGSNSVKSKYATQTIIRLASPGTVTVKKYSTTEDTAVVTWQKVKGATKYYVYYRKAGESAYKVKKVSVSKTKTTVPVTGTMENEIYVKAVATGGSSGARSAIKKITPYWYRVLLVGEYDYTNGSKDLPGIRYDVNGMRDLFLKQTNSVKTLTNASASTILAGIRSAFGGASPNTVCVFMFSGHGSTGSGNYSGALSCSNGSIITAATLKSTMDKLKINNIVILLGSCGSGGFIDPTMAEEQNGGLNPDAFNNAFIRAFRTSSPTAGEFKAKGYTVIAGAAAHESGFCCWWTNRFKQIVNGGTDIMIALAKAGGYEYCDDGGFNAGFGSRKGDSNKDKKVTVKEAYSYAKKQVTRSHVQFWSARPELILFQ